MKIHNLFLRRLRTHRFLARQGKEMHGMVVCALQGKIDCIDNFLQKQTAKLIHKYYHLLEEINAC